MDDKAIEAAREVLDSAKAIEGSVQDTLEHKVGVAVWKLACLKGGVIMARAILADEEVHRPRDKLIISVDFDGVIHAYTTPWKAAHIVPDGPVPGALEWLKEATKHFRVSIFSSRSATEQGRRAMRQWLYVHGKSAVWLNLIEWPSAKPPAHLSIDDRGLNFRGDWSEFQDFDKLKVFRPWNK